MFFFISLKRLAKDKQVLFTLLTLHPMHNYMYIKSMCTQSIFIFLTVPLFALKPANYHLNKIPDYACERPRTLDRNTCKPFTDIRHYNSMCLKKQRCEKCRLHHSGFQCTRAESHQPSKDMLVKT